MHTAFNGESCSSTFLPLTLPFSTVCCPHVRVQRWGNISDPYQSSQSDSFRFPHSLPEQNHAWITSALLTVYHTHIEHQGQMFLFCFSLFCFMSLYSSNQRQIFCLCSNQDFRSRSGEFAALLLLFIRLSFVVV